MNMRVAHLLRKYNPAEWGGTETALQRLFEGLRPHGIIPAIYCPVLRQPIAAARDPFLEAGYEIRRFRACVPVWSATPEEKRQLVAVGGNLMSFDLPVKLWRDRSIGLIHSHALGRLGAIARLVARRRGLPFVLTIHGGVLDLPESLRQSFEAPHPHGWEWGKFFGWLLQSRRLLDDADAILTCNPREAELLQAQYPGRRIQVQPHGVAVRLFQAEDHRESAYHAFPQLRGKRLLLAVSRIDPIKNQGWLIAQTPALLQKHPEVRLVLVGACTDMGYGAELLRTIQKLGVEEHVLLTGGLSPGDPRLIGLFQAAAAVVLPSVSETFGLVILEAWAAGTVPIASRTSGATALIQSGENGWLFSLKDPSTFHAAVNQTLGQPALAARMITAGQHRVRTEYDLVVLAGQIKRLYEELIEQQRALRHPSR